MCELVLLPKVALLRGPFGDPTDYEVTGAFLVDDEHVMYGEDGVIYLARADKLRDSLYAATQHNTVDFFVEGEHDPAAIIAEIVGKLRSVSALEFLRELVQIPGDHAIYYR